MEKCITPGLYPGTKLKLTHLILLGNGVSKYNKVSRQGSPELFSDYFRGDFNSLSEDQKLRSVMKTMDNIMLEVRDMYMYCLLKKVENIPCWFYFLHLDSSASGWSQVW